MLEGRGYRHSAYCRGVRFELRYFLLSTNENRSDCQGCEVLAYGGRIMKKSMKSGVVLSAMSALSFMIILSSCGSILLSSGTAQYRSTAQDDGSASSDSGTGSEGEGALQAGATDEGADELTAAQRFELWMNAKEDAKQFDKLVKDYPFLESGTYESYYMAAAQETFSREAVLTNEVIQKDRALLEAIKGYDPSKAETVSAIADMLGGRSLGVVDSSGHSYSYTIDAKAEHCYVSFGKWKMTLGAESATEQWNTQHILKYQVWDVALLSEYEAGKVIDNQNNLSRNHLSGVCVTRDQKLSYDLSLEFPGNSNSYRFSIIEIPKKSMPNYLRVQAVSHAMDDVCTPYLWAEHWTHPVPGTLYYKDSVPVLVTGHYWPNIGRYRAFPTEYSVVTPYYEESIVSWKDVTSKAESLRITSAHLPVLSMCSQGRMDPELSQCANSKESSYECCSENVKEILQSKSADALEVAKASGKYAEALRNLENDINMGIAYFCGNSQENNDIFYGQIVDSLMEVQSVQDYNLSDYYLDF